MNLVESCWNDILMEFNRLYHPMRGLSLVYRDIARLLELVTVSCNFTIIHYRHLYFVSKITQFVRTNQYSLLQSFLQAVDVLIDIKC